MLLCASLEFVDIKGCVFLQAKASVVFFVQKKSLYGYKKKKQRSFWKSSQTSPAFSVVCLASPAA